MSQGKQGNAHRNFFWGINDSSHMTVKAWNKASEYDNSQLFGISSD